MNRTLVKSTTPRVGDRVILRGTRIVGDRVILRGTRIVGDVAHVGGRSARDRISVKVTEVVGKSSGSKAARAWRGAWVTCPPTMVTARSSST